MTIVLFISEREVDRSYLEEGLPEPAVKDRSGKDNEIALRRAPGSPGYIITLSSPLQEENVIITPCSNSDELEAREPCEIHK